jgi:transcriptional regulator with XRE-family HTH domain
MTKNNTSEPCEIDADVPRAKDKISLKLPRKIAPPKNVAQFREALSDVKSLTRALDLSDVHPAALEIGQTIRRVRIAKGMTQVGLAEAAGISQAALSDIELGKGSDGPSYRILREIARALELDLLQKEPSGESVEIKPDPPDVIRIAEGADECAIFAPSIDGLIKVLFDKKEVSDVCTTLRKFQGRHARVRAIGDYQCRMFRVEPRAHMRVATLAPAVFVILSGLVRVKSVRAVDAVKQAYIVPGNETVDVVNPRAKPSSFLSVPAACFFSAADWK